MQIHELTQPGKPRVDEVFDTTRTFLKNPKSLLSRQGRINAQAAGAAAKLSKQGYTGEAPTLDQALAKFQQNPAAQQWVNSIVAKWPAQAANIAKQISTTGPVTEADTIYFPGSKKPLDPNNPNDAQVLAAMSQQGLVPSAGLKQRAVGGLRQKRRSAKLAPAVAQTPADQYKSLFRDWVDQELKTIRLDTIEKSDTKLKSRLEGMLNDIVNNQNNLPAQQKLVHDFFSLAVAANHMITARNRLGQYGSPGAGGVQNTDQDPDQTIPLDAAQQLNLRSRVRSLGIRQAKSTRVPALDKFLQTLGVTIIP